MSAPPAVVIVTTYYPPVLGGVETSAEQLARHLAHSGHRVTVLTKRTSTTHPAQEVLDGVRVVRSGPTGRRRGIGKWLAIPGLFLNLWRRRGTYDVIVCLDFRAIGIAALLAGRIVGCPVVFGTSTEGTVSGQPIRQVLARFGFAPDGPMARVLTWPVRAVYRRADMFACVSRAIEHELIGSGVAPERITYLPHGVDTALFSPVTADVRQDLRRTLQLPMDVPIAVFVGRLSREKGVMELLDAWGQLPPPRPLLVLVGPDMAGHAWDVGRQGREWVRSRGLDDVVRFAGGVPPESVPGWLQAADIAVQPSHFEAFGISALEAMAVGLPVVVSDAGGFKDYVEDGVHGFRVPVRNAEALSKALRRLTSDPALRREFGEAGRRVALEFEVSSVLARFTAMIDRLGTRMA